MSTADSTKTVLELDLASYSDIARVLEENLDVHAVKAFQDQIQSFVDDGLRRLGLRREDVVFGTAGDNALLFFDEPAIAHRFAGFLQGACAEHNRTKGLESAKRWFRIGAATGPVLVMDAERRIVGTTVARSVRLEAAARKGQLVVDMPTFEALPEDLKACYSPEEVVRGKRDEIFTARRCTFVEVPEALTDPSSTSVDERTQDRRFFRVTLGILILTFLFSYFIGTRPALVRYVFWEGTLAGDLAYSIPGSRDGGIVGGLIWGSVSTAVTALLAFVLWLFRGHLRTSG